MPSKKNFILIILDGWGIGPDNESNPIYTVKPKTLEWLAANYPLTSLQASGIAVGLPWGEVGNSEVGHLTLGAGKVLYQYYPKITMAIQDGTFYENAVLKAAFAHARETGGAINLAGLLTKANVHASLNHLLALIKMAEQEFTATGIAPPKINLHLFADGKDSPPRTLESFLAEVPRQYLATLMGRYYGMDRTGNWHATEIAYRTMLGLSGTLVTDPAPLIAQAYQESITEEYVAPMRFGTTEDAVGADGTKIAGDFKKITDGDALVFFNYREDSIRQLASAFIKKDFNEFTTAPFKNLFVATMSHYDDSFDVPVVFPADTVENTLGKTLSDAGLSQLRLAETYKYAHVTYFFNGLREEPYPNEYRTLVPSLEGIHPEEHPEMAAGAITDRLVEAIRSRSFDFTLVNYANGDAIAHSANLDAALEAVKVIDRELARVIEAAGADPDTIVLITADHGNIEEMIDPMTGAPESQHDASPVPLHIMAAQYKGRRFINQDTLVQETLGSLADVAPTLLELMGVAKPAEMNGRSLLDEIV